jgi:hypothetical protein
MLIRCADGTSADDHQKDREADGNVVNQLVGRGADVDDQLVAGGAAAAGESTVAGVDSGVD